MLQEEFVSKILEVLSPMSDVTAIKSKGHIVLYKEGVMFGKIIEQSVLLLSVSSSNHKTQFPQSRKFLSRISDTIK